MAVSLNSRLESNKEEKEDTGKIVAAIAWSINDQSVSLTHSLSRSPTLSFSLDQPLSFIWLLTTYWSESRNMGMVVAAIAWCARVRVGIIYKVLHRQLTGPSPPHRLDVMVDRSCAIGDLRINLVLEQGLKLPVGAGR